MISGCEAGSGDEGTSFGKDLVSLGDYRFTLYLDQDHSGEPFQKQNEVPTGRAVLYDWNNKLEGDIHTKKELNSKLGWKKFTPHITMDQNNIATPSVEVTKMKSGALHGFVWIDEDGKVGVE